MQFKDFETLVSCVRHLSNFCGAFYNLVPISSSFSLVSTQCFLAGFFFRSDTVDLILLISSWMPLELRTVFLGNL
jgi:hypothetical protein